MYSRSIFMETVSMDALIIKIMNFAQKLVDADRASLFLVDVKTNQLYARIFDIQGPEFEEKKNAEGDEADKTKEVRLALVATCCGRVCNIRLSGFRSAAASPATWPKRATRSTSRTPTATPASTSRSTSRPVTQPRPSSACPSRSGARLSVWWKWSTRRSEISPR